MLALQLEGVVPPGTEGQVLVIETRISRHDARRILAAFDMGPTPGRPAMASD